MSKQQNKSEFQITDHTAKECLFKLAEYFLSFGIDPAGNIAKLTQFCGEFLGADGAMYDRMAGMKLTRLSGWNLPAGGHPSVLGKDKAGYDQIKMGHGDIFEIQHLDANPKTAND